MKVLNCYPSDKVIPNHVDSIDDAVGFIEKNNIIIISPHCDDDLYSCMSWFEDAKKNNYQLVLVFVTAGNHQSIRLDRYGEICNIIDYPITIISLEAFLDGDGNVVPLKSLVSQFDRIVEVSNILLIPESSDHQDHHVINKACLASLRYRDKLPVGIKVYAYNYVYNYEKYPPTTYKKLSTEWMEYKLRCLGELDTVDKILTNRVNSIDNIKHLAAVRGCMINEKYAETFRLIREAQQ